MKMMAVDFGEARTGLAVCDETELLASPAGIIAEKSATKTVAKIAAAATEQGAKLVVVGLPRNMDGTEGERAQRCRYIAGQLEELLPGTPVVLWDERATTKTALSILDETGTYGKKRKSVLDAVAATIILESYMEYRKNHPEGASEGPEGEW